MSSSYDTIMLMGIVEAIVLGFVQGMTEFLPVSSSGHLIVVRSFFSSPTALDLSFDAVLQFSTILAVLVYFRKDLWNLLVSFFRLLTRKSIEEKERTLLYAIIVGTIPAVIFGLILEEKMATVFRNTDLVAMMLILGSILMFFAEKHTRPVTNLTVKKGFFIGLFQSLALFPGVSRSGVTISGGLFQGLSRSEATRFSFILSFPVIFGSGLKKIIDLYSGGLIYDIGFPLLVSFIVAFVFGLISIHYLLKYLENHSLNVFVVYRILLAIVIIVII